MRGAHVAAKHVGDEGPCTMARRPEGFLRDGLHVGPADVLAAAELGVREDRRQLLAVGEAPAEAVVELS